MSILNFYPLIIIGLLVLPILSKLIFTGNLKGFCSKFYGKSRKVMFGSMDAVWHTILGFSAGMLMSPMKFSDNKTIVTVRNILVLLLGISYPGYDLIKRGIKHADYFGESSYYMNVTDFVLGMTIGYVIGLIIHSIMAAIQKKKVEFAYPVNKGVSITLLGLIILISLTTIVLSTRRNTQSQDCQIQKLKGTYGKQDPIDPNMPNF